jgi:hypothetical protein
VVLRDHNNLVTRLQHVAVRRVDRDAPLDRRGPPVPRAERAALLVARVPHADHDRELEPARGLAKREPDELRPLFQAELVAKEAEQRLVARGEARVLRADHQQPPDDRVGDDRLDERGADERERGLAVDEVGLGDHVALRRAREGAQREHGAQRGRVRDARGHGGVCEHDDGLGRVRAHLIERRQQVRHAVPEEDP